MLTFAQAIVFSTLFVTLVLFIIGRWRYDLVALLALLAVTISGVVPSNEAFTGFGHPAVVIVAAVLVVTRGLLNSGVVDLIITWMAWIGARPALQVAALTGLVAAISGFVSSVAAAAIAMPVALQMARRSNTSPSILLMPIAFGSLLGATLTLIGSAPNIIIASFRIRTAGEPFGMFDYTPVGLGVALAGVLFISLIGWRLIPQRKGQSSDEERFKIDDYVTEGRVPEQSKLIGKPLNDLARVTKADVQIVGLVRDGRKLLAPSGFETMRAGDILIIEADEAALKALVDTARLELVGSQQLGEDDLQSDEVSVMEAGVMPNSVLLGRTVPHLNLRWRYGINLLAVARQGQPLRT